MGSLRALQRRRRLRRIEQHIDKTLLILDRQPNDIVLLDRSLRDLLRGRDHEVAQAAPLQFGRTPDDRQSLRGDPGLKPCAACRVLCHGKSPYLPLYVNPPYKPRKFRHLPETAPLHT